ncbi:MAG: hypothetical protein H0U92_03490 [Actinobacteria bacterium]|nr:hypothetical protein [Actinomycetota bacterium]
MSVCVVVAGDDGARTASHALRAAGWGGVHFEASPAAAVRVSSGGRATVLNVSRSSASDTDAALAELVALGIGHDWRTPPPDLSEEEWGVLYGRANLTPRKTTLRLASASEKFGAQTDADLHVAFARWRLPEAD